MYAIDGYFKCFHICASLIKASFLALLKKLFFSIQTNSILKGHINDQL